MQDKNLNDLTKKYKEEMMRLYSRNRTPAVSVPQNTMPPKNERITGNVRPPQTMSSASPPKAVHSEKPAAEDMRPREKTENIVRNSPRTLYSRADAPKETVLPEERLSHPPMPEIPKNYSAQSAQGTRGAQTAQGNRSERSIRQSPARPTPKADKTEKRPAASKFPSAEELLNGVSDDLNVPSMADTAEDTRLPEPRFVPTEEHNQGNYDFSPVPGASDTEDFGTDMQGEIIPNESYPNEDTDFSAVDQNDEFPEDNPNDMSGQGYLQVEVTTASRAVPVQDATVIITESVNGMDSLIGMAVTDENGGTPVIPLSAPLKSFSEAPDPSERPYSEYNIRVYKQGFYTVPQLTVPIFDSIKSIQPVSLIPLAEFELEGAGEPNENR